MKNKRISALLLLVCLVVSLVSCAEYNGPVNNGGNSGGGSAGGPTLDDDETNDFTVTLMLDGKPYSPKTALNVHWNDGYSIHVAPVDETGVARVDGLDGDYRVSLSSNPPDCTYDPNAYVATNDNRNIVIEMYTLGTLSGTGVGAGAAVGTGLYNCHEISGTGVYTVTIEDEEVDTDGDGFFKTIYFEFSPQINGTYTIESWASTADDEINPICTAYLGSSAYKYGGYEVTDVSSYGSFTRNFLHKIEIADQMISTGGSQTFTFAISAETKSGIYPVTFSFAIKRNGGFDLGSAERVMIAPTFDFSDFDFDSFNALAGNELVYAETLYPGTTSSYIYDEDCYRIWEKSEGGDGVYHVYDPEKYPETGGYGPMLVAFISKPCKYIDKAFTEIEYVGNKALTVNGTENYKQFIEGYDAVASGGYYCTNDCPCHIDEPVGAPRACAPGCTECTKNCTPCPAEMMNMVGYSSYCNADGVAPVTEELAEFLQKFAISQRYFADGDGWAEKTGVDAYEDSQWLFACAYYAE